MVSHEHRCIFLHIPKTAGTSIEKKLGHFEELALDVQDHRTIRELEPFHPRHLKSLIDRQDPFLLKKLRNGLRGQPAPTPQQYRTYYKFTFVRNTWSRVFSWYRNVMTNPAFLAERGLTGECSLRDFLLRFPADWGLRSQLYWIEDSRGEIPLDHVGRFENLASDFEKVCERLGLGDPGLPRLIAGEGKRYTDFYDEESVSIVAARYRKEIELFGFRFGE